MTMPDLPCLKCGELNTVSIAVVDGDTFTCTDCDGEFYLADVRNAVAAWSAVLPWLESHPAVRADANHNTPAETTS